MSKYAARMTDPIELPDGSVWIQEEEAGPSYWWRCVRAATDPRGENDKRVHVLGTRSNRPGWVPQAVLRDAQNQLAIEQAKVRGLTDENAALRRALTEQHRADPGAGGDPTP